MNRGDAQSAEVHVVHFGNSPWGQGGIASVIRAHLLRTGGPTQSTCAITYNQEGRSALSRNAPLLSSIAHLFRLNRSHLIHVHLAQKGSLLREGLVILLARTLGRSTVVTLHGSSLFQPSRLLKFGVTLLLRSATITHGFSDVYRGLYRVPPSRWTFIPNEVAIPRNEPDPSIKRKQAIFVGEVGTRKGIDLLIEAWRLLNNTQWQLIVVGPFASGFNISSLGAIPLNVTFTGALKHSVALAMMDESKILLQPSRAEAFPVAVCEAMVRGCAIVGTPVGGMGELLSSADQLIAQPTARALADAVGILLDDDEELASRSTLAQEYANANLSSHVVSKKWENLYCAMRKKNVA